jgi:hypothetical protein
MNVLAIQVFYAYVNVLAMAALVCVYMNMLATQTLVGVYVNVLAKLLYKLLRMYT